MVVQNAMISGYGLWLKRLRYGHDFERTLAQLTETERYTADALRAVQANRLAALVMHAGAHVPFYSALLERAGIRPHEVNIDNLARALPILTKEQICASSTALVSSAYARRALVPLKTSGTTGTALTVLATRRAIQQNFAFFARFLAWAGVKIGQPSATFAGRLVVPIEQSRPPFWRVNWTTRTTLFSSYHISRDNMPHYIRQLERTAPAFIDSYPSAIFTIASYLKEQGDAHKIRPRAIITSSETLSPHQRDVIEEVFRCPVFDQYGNVEMAAFIGQCEKGTYHISPEYGFVEVLDAQGRPARPGEAGELICTGLLNFAMPLIRYRIGDSVVVGTKSCGCGRNFPVVDSVIGRTDDMIVTPEGRYVGRLSPVFKLFPSVREAQVIQDRLDHVTVKIVCGEDYTDAVGAALIREFQLRTGASLQVSLDRVDAIPRTAAGKFRSVVSLLNRNGQLSV